MKRPAKAFQLSAVLLGVETLLTGQTVVNGGRTQIGPWDASGAVYTIPAKRGLTAQLPSTCTQGAEYFATDATPGQNIYLCTATNTWTQQTGGTAYTFRNNLTNTAGTVDFTPLDSSVMNAVEEFLPSRNYNGLIGTLGWGVTTLGTACGNYMSQGVANHPGIFYMSSGGNSGDGCSLTLSDAADGAVYPFTTMGSGGAWSYWEMQAIIETDANSVGSARFLAGFSDNQAAYHPANGNEIAVRYDVAGGGCPSNESTTNWVYEVIVSGTKTCVNSGLVVSPATWYHMRIYSSAPGTIQFQINGANSGTITTAPTDNLAPQFINMSTGGGAEGMSVDWWAMKIQGLTR